MPPRMRADKIVKGGRRALTARAAPSKKTVGSQAKSKASTTTEDNDLLANIRALGGDEEDYKIVKDVDSDDVQEFEGKKPNVRKFSHTFGREIFIRQYRRKLRKTLLRS